MRRLLLLASACATVSSTLHAQTLTVTPLGGSTKPIAGEMQMWAPAPFNDSVLVHHRFRPGATLGVMMEVARPRWPTLAIIASVNLAERRFGLTSSPPPDCARCSSTIYGLATLATVNPRIGGRIRLHLGAGPEILHMDGEATKNDNVALPPDVVEVNPRTLVGGFAMFGVSLAVNERSSVRVQAGYRYFAPQHKKAPSAAPDQPNFSDTPYEDVLVTAGFSFRVP